MKQSITAIISAIFNIVTIVVSALGYETVAKVLIQVAPEVNIIAVAIMWFFGYQTNVAARKTVK